MYMADSDLTIKIKDSRKKFDGLVIYSCSRKLRNLKGVTNMSLQEIEVNRKEVLEIVKVNKQKHDKILADAVEGYWLDAEKTLKKYKEDRLKELKKYYQKNVKDLKKQIRDDLELVAKRKKDGPFTHLRSTFPEDHSDDYNSVIRKLELCVEDTIELYGDEFDQYIRNKWSWRNSFLTTNCGYAITGAYAVSASWSCQSVSGSYATSSSLSSGNVGSGTTNPTYSLNVDF